jgi:hypothetical protein
VTGAITWPAALRNEKYEPLRNRVDELFRTQLGYRDPQRASAKETLRNLALLRRALLSDRGQMSREQYLSATRFLIGLQLEAESLAQTS